MHFASSSIGVMHLEFLVSFLIISEEFSNNLGIEDLA